MKPVLRAREPGGAEATQQGLDRQEGRSPAQGLGAQQRLLPFLQGYGSRYCILEMLLLFYQIHSFLLNI